MRHHGVTICGRPVRPIKSRKLKNRPIRQAFSPELEKEEVVANTVEVIVVNTEEEVEEPQPLIIGTGSYLNTPKEDAEEEFKEDKAYTSPAVETAIEVLGEIVKEEVKKEKKSKKKRKYTRRKKSKKLTVVSEQD